MYLIGNPRQQADNDIAVADALPLSKCWQQLQATLKAAVLVAPSRKRPDNADRQRWINAWDASDMATLELSSAIADGVLQIWRINNAREVPVTPKELLPSTIRSGVFRSYERRIDEKGESKPLEMQGAVLWVKVADWKRFHAKSKRLRGDVPPNRQLDHDLIKAMADKYREDRPDLSIGSAAASIVKDLGPNPKNGNPWDQRNIERIIARHWGEASQTSPP